MSDTAPVPFRVSLGTRTTAALEVHCNDFFLCVCLFAKDEQGRNRLRRMLTWGRVGRRSARAFISTTFLSAFDYRHVGDVVARTDRLHQ